MHCATLTTFALACLGFAAGELQGAPASIIEEIAPGSASCDPELTECRTASQAAPWIFRSLFQYGIYEPSQMAAVVSLIAFESGDFAYKRNVFPGRPGQGTANMQMAPFNLLYAQSIPALKPKVANITSTEGLSDNELNRILNLVVPDEYNFGSGPWFLTSQCPEEVLGQLTENIDAGFQAYMECVGVEVTEDRLAYLDRAKAAFQV